MKLKLALAGLLLCSLSAHGAAAEDYEINEGDTLQTLSNLHADFDRSLIYTMNYQLSYMIPVCAEVTVTKVGKKKMEFEYQGTPFTIAYEKYTKKAGVAFPEAVKSFFGPACDADKMASLSDKDKEGIERGEALIGMSKDGVLFAMGRPPFHVNRDLESQTMWMYWRNRFAKRAIRFDNEDMVREIE